MFFISYSVLWSVNYFFAFLYITSVFSVIIYSTFSVKENFKTSKFKKINTFEYLIGFDIFWLLLTPLFLFLLINSSWVSCSLSAWFGNIIYSQFQSKVSYLIIFFFYLIITTYCSSFYFSSKEIFDYLIICFNFFFWIHFIFFSNSIFTFIFFIEILSTLIFLLIVSSTFSTTYFYNNLNLNLHNYFSQTTPFFFIQMLLYFFWISLISSLNLFFFLILFYLKFLTFDWFVFEFIFSFIVSISDLKDLFTILLIWFTLLFSIFLKCGLVPFYFWKPVFFKGMPLHALFFYILFFYFFLFLFFLVFFIIYLNEIFYYFLIVNISILLSGFLILLSILCEAYYLKSFLALSSILNTLFIFLGLNSTVIFDLPFYF